MRELKFRAWNDEKYIYAPNRFVYTDDYDKNDVDCYEDIGAFFATRDNIEQYTGLKDKNGKEIYEGDIILHHKMMACNQDFFGTTKCNGVVEWDDEKTGYCPFNGYDIQWDLNYLAKDVEVVGNIHENPELLKGEE